MHPCETVVIKATEIKKSGWDRLAGDMAAVISDGCTNCGACQVNCAFLNRYGTPKEICADIDLDLPQAVTTAFSCSLCGLCTVVCPEKLDPCFWFLIVRRAAVAGGRTDLSRYRTILGYEKKGTSGLFSYYGFPEGCDTVFFPGCTLPGTRPDSTWKLFQHLKSSLPSLGIVLDCCTKPSHDLGRHDYFQAMFGEMVGYLKANNISRVWLACPNCYKIFKEYAPELQVESIYEILDRLDLPVVPTPGQHELVVHDPCPMRDDSVVHESVRSLLGKLNITIGKMAFQKRRTFCCGEGGAVGFIDPELAGSWTAAREKSAKGRTIVTYCAGCAGFLGRVCSSHAHSRSAVLYGKNPHRQNFPGKSTVYLYPPVFFQKKAEENNALSNYPRKALFIKIDLLTADKQSQATAVRGEQ